MAKRNAGYDLNADNWNDEEEPEEAGTFSKATADVIGTRVIKTAKRRLAASSEASGKSAFSSFTGFKATAPSTSSSSLFSFLKNSNTDIKTPTKPSETTTMMKNEITNGSMNIKENGKLPKAMEIQKKQKLPTEELSKGTDPNVEQDKISQKKSTEYYSSLKNLNQSVTKWIEQHVETNPVCILTPIFRDYEKYLSEIEKKYSKTVDSSPSAKENKEKITDGIRDSKTIPSNTNNSNGKPTLVSNNTSSEIPTEEKKESSIFGSQNIPSSLFSNISKSENTSFGNVAFEKNTFLNKLENAQAPSSESSIKPEDKSSSLFSQPSTTSLGSSIFSFGQKSPGSTGSAGYSFGGSQPFSFAAQVAQSQQNKEKEDEEQDEEDEEPPKPEFAPVTESGAIYEQRCKVFVKADNNYKDKGVGTLFLKPTPNEKTQLIVRASTSLGNLLLNTLLTDNIPLKRMNKTNVMLVCLPLPDSKPPPTPVLLRVKTEEDCDALLEALEKHKK